MILIELWHLAGIRVLILIIQISGFSISLSSLSSLFLLSFAHSNTTVDKTSEDGEFDEADNYHENDDSDFLSS